MVQYSYGRCDIIGIGIYMILGTLMMLTPAVILVTKKVRQK